MVFLVVDVLCFFSLLYCLRKAYKVAVVVDFVCGDLVLLSAFFYDAKRMERVCRNDAVAELNTPHFFECELYEQNWMA